MYKFILEAMLPEFHLTGGVLCAHACSYGNIVNVMIE